MDLTINNPKISVIMPVFNAEPFIAQAINSILAQTYGNFEFLILDDSSTDKTIEIIGRFSDDRIRLLQNNRKSGIKDTLNKGIEEAKNELIARMDADDIAHPWRFEKQVAYMVQHPECALLSTGVNIIDEAGKYIRTESVRSEYLYYSLNFECSIFHSTILFRKTKILSIGGYKLPYAEDYDLFWRTAQLYIISSLEEPLLSYREHEQNTSMVSKREEYDLYTLRTIKRNIQYYVGEAINLKRIYIECYRYNFKPILAENNIDEIIACLNLLETISNEIKATQNPNRDPDILREIAKFKTNYILFEILKHLSYLKVLQILFRLHKFSQLPGITMFRFKNMMKTPKP